MATSVRSFSKINLGLAIGPPRPDGFHELVTLYQTLEAHDVVTVEANPSEQNRVLLTSNDARVPTDSRNTAWKMLDQAMQRLLPGFSAEVSVHIEKGLPVQGGLGAGSANAVAALIGLERELRRQFSGAECLEIAAAVGSDVPLFLIGGTVLGLGRGEEVYPMPDLEPIHCVVALPSIGVSTPLAFQEWDLTEGKQLTAEANFDRLKELGRVLSAGLSGAFFTEEGRPEDPLLALVRTGIENDFEKVVFRQYPFLGEIKRILEPEAVYAALSGSGSAVFGLYQTEEAARKAEEALAGQGTACLRTKTLSRREYWQTMVETR
jgi:4-diphosphocytidyl-2-C-methyl-D-erythritol kinase